MGLGLTAGSHFAEQRAGDVRIRLGESLGAGLLHDPRLFLHTALASNTLHEMKRRLEAK